MKSLETLDFKTVDQISDDQTEAINEKSKKQTDKKLRLGAEKLVSLFCKEFDVEGRENIIDAQKKDPDAKFIITSSHISNLDAPAAIKALGDRFNIQVTAESVLFGFTPQEIMFRMGGKDNFTPIKYQKNKKVERGKQGVFNPDDFKAISEKMEQGRTPWMTIHPFTEKEKMQPPRIGAVYLANKTGAKIIPTALEIKGESISLEGLKELAKGLWSRKKGEAKAIYHIGEPIDLPKIDISIIESVLEKKLRGKSITEKEFNEFRKTHCLLKKQADRVAEIINAMLPKNQQKI